MAEEKLLRQMIMYKDKNGIEKFAEVLCAFEVGEDKNKYVVYTTDDMDEIEEGKTDKTSSKIVLVSEIKEGEIVKFEGISEELWTGLISKIIITLAQICSGDNINYEATIKANMNFDNFNLINIDNIIKDKKIIEISETITKNAAPVYYLNIIKKVNLEYAMLKQEETVLENQINTKMEEDNNQSKEPMIEESTEEKNEDYQIEPELKEVLDQIALDVKKAVIEEPSENLSSAEEVSQLDLSLSQSEKEFDDAILSAYKDSEKIKNEMLISIEQEPINYLRNIVNTMQQMHDETIKKLTEASKKCIKDKETTIVSDYQKEAQEIASKTEELLNKYKDLSVKFEQAENEIKDYYNENIDLKKAIFDKDETIRELGVRVNEQQITNDSLLDTISKKEEIILEQKQKIDDMQEKENKTQLENLELKKQLENSQKENNENKLSFEKQLNEKDSIIKEKNIKNLTDENVINTLTNQINSKNIELRELTDRNTELQNLVSNIKNAVGVSGTISFENPTDGNTKTK
ncbi:MAG: hypothetical protein PHN42_00400 [Bacilli bacterium]|nr:hypothetical protein [Bacilli bacterium]